MDAPQARRIAATLRHVLGGDAEDFSLARCSTAAAVPLQQHDAPALMRLLDHDNHEMRAKMKEFMKDPLFLPARPNAGPCRPSGRAQVAWGCPQPRVPAPAALRHAAGGGARAGAGEAQAHM